mmetsp:Transcript_2366/g.3167  ORF Transcript_2366/g.3167 Transcript_2366/m.3167 type:complete len:201 (+) Transcript_2366:681-1283(+)
MMMDGEVKVVLEKVAKVTMMMDGEEKVVLEKVVKVTMTMGGEEKVVLEKEEAMERVMKDMKVQPWAKAGTWEEQAGTARLVMIMEDVALVQPDTHHNHNNRCLLLTLNQNQRHSLKAGRQRGMIKGDSISSTIRPKRLSGRCPKASLQCHPLLQLLGMEVNTSGLISVMLTALAHIKGRYIVAILKETVLLLSIFAFEYI